ncbi:MAG: hypothetical protein V3T86_02240 [Planctomycetota bacterium]
MGKRRKKRRSQKKPGGFSAKPKGKKPEEQEPEPGNLEEGGVGGSFTSHDPDGGQKFFSFSGQLERQNVPGPFEELDPTTTDAFGATDGFTVTPGETRDHGIDVPDESPAPEETEEPVAPIREAPGPFESDGNTHTYTHTDTWRAPDAAPGEFVHPHDPHTDPIQAREQIPSDVDPALLETRDATPGEIKRLWEAHEETAFDPLLRVSPDIPTAPAEPAEDVGEPAQPDAAPAEETASQSSAMTADEDTHTEAIGPGGLLVQGSTPAAPASDVVDMRSAPQQESGTESKETPAEDSTSDGEAAAPADVVHEPAEETQLVAEATDALMDLGDETFTEGLSELKELLFESSQPGPAEEEEATPPPVREAAFDERASDDTATEAFLSIDGDHTDTSDSIARQTEADVGAAPNQQDAATETEDADELEALEPLDAPKDLTTSDSSAPAQPEVLAEADTPFSDCADETFTEGLSRTDMFTVGGAPPADEAESEQARDSAEALGSSRAVSSKRGPLSEDPADRLLDGSVEEAVEEDEADVSLPPRHKIAARSETPNTPSAADAESPDEEPAPEAESDEPFTQIGEETFTEGLDSLRELTVGDSATDTQIVAPEHSGPEESSVSDAPTADTAADPADTPRETEEDVVHPGVGEAAQSESAGDETFTADGTEIEVEAATPAAPTPAEATPTDAEAAGATKRDVSQAETTELPIESATGDTTQPIPGDEHSLAERAAGMDSAELGAADTAALGPSPDTPVEADSIDLTDLAATVPDETVDLSRIGESAETVILPGGDPQQPFAKKTKTPVDPDATDPEPALDATKSEFKAPLPPDGHEHSAQSSAEHGLTRTDMLASHEVPQREKTLDQPAGASQSHVLKDPEFHALHVAEPSAEPADHEAGPVPRRKRFRDRAQKRGWFGGAFAGLASLVKKRERKATWTDPADLEELALFEPAPTTSGEIDPELQTDSDLLGEFQSLERPADAAAKGASAGPAAPSATGTSPEQKPRTIKDRVRQRANQLGIHLGAVLASLFVAGQRDRALEVGPKGAAWWRRTLIEIGTLYAILIPIELTVTQGRIGAYGVHPHPYWLVVLPMAGARGVVAGLVAAAVASLLYAVGAIQALGTLSLDQVFTLRRLMEPVLFFGAGFFLGELHDELSSRHKKLQLRMKKAEDQYGVVRQERDVLQEANRELERRIVDHSAQFGNIIVAAQRIEESDRSEIFEVALDLVAEHCGASASVLLLLGDGAVDYVCHRGWPDEQRSERLGSARRSPLLRRAIEDGRTINGFSPDVEAPPDGPLVVAPLFDERGVLKALLCLDEIPPSRLNESTINTFVGIADWIGKSLARLGKQDAVPTPNSSEGGRPQDELRLGTTKEFGERLRIEYERSARYGVPTAILAIHAIEWSDTTREGDGTIDRFMMSQFTGGLRPSDAIYRFGYPGCYIIVLAGTTPEGAEVVRGRLLRRVEYSATSAIGRIEIYAEGPDADAPDLMSLMERVAQLFRRSSPLALGSHVPVAIPDWTPIGDRDALIRRVRVETSIAVRNGFDLHVVGITAPDSRAEYAEGLARHLEEVSRGILRPSDGAYSVTKNQCAVVLPNTDPESSAIVAHKLVSALRERDPDAPYGNIETLVLGLGTHYPDTDSFMDALTAARVSEHTATSSQEDET